MTMQSKLLGGFAGRWMAASVVSSLVLQAVVYGLVSQVWYPDPYARILHVHRLLAFFLLTDLLLAWLAPWVACRGEKSRAQRWMDGLVVLGGRVAVAVYCVSEIVAARPVFLVHAVDRLDVVSRFELSASPAADQIGLWHGPAHVGLVMPAAPKEREQVIMFELSGGNLSADSRYFGAYKHEDLMKRAHPLSDLLERYPARRVEIEALARQIGYRVDALRWLPMKTRFGFSTALIAADRPGILAWIDWDPA